MARYDNILFDLYGTLVDIKTDETMPFLWRVMADYYSYSNAKYTPEELKKSFYESINRQIQGKEEDFEVEILDTFKYLYDIKNAESNKALLISTAKEFRKTSTLLLKLYDGVNQGLTSLKKSGKKLYLLTNAQHHFTYQELESLDLLKFFDDIFISSDYGVKKPSPLFFDQPFKKYGLEKNKTIMVGNDGTADILGAKNYGIDTMYVKTEISPKESIPPANYVFTKHNFSLMTKVLLS